MKGFLFLGLVGAAIYALLVYTHDVYRGVRLTSFPRWQPIPITNPAPKFVGYSP